MNNGITRGRSVALTVLVAALVGMAYTHIKDVGMKFDEHVYYMAYLFCGNIVASAALAAFATASYVFGPLAWLQRTLRATVGLALSTIAGFLWSRTVGFPQMSDHIGQWDPLGITSLICEGIVATVSVGLLARLRRAAVDGPAPARRRRVVIPAVGAVVALALSVAAVSAFAGTSMDGMHYGNMANYPDLAHASAANVARARRLHVRTNHYAPQFDTPRKARRLGYRTDPAERRQLGCPGVVHFRKHGTRVWGRLLDPKAPQSLVFWCDSMNHYTYIGAMYRAPRNALPPTWGGVLGWHRHGPTGTWMTHVWIARHTAPSLATCVPFNALERSVGIRYETYVLDAPGVDSPCSDTRGITGMPAMPSA